MSYRIGPYVAGTFGREVDEALRSRARAFVGAVGVVKARELLHVGADTLEAACNRGNIKPATAERLRAALDREEPLLVERAAS